MINDRVKEFIIEKPSNIKFSKIIEDLYWARLPLPFRLDHVNVFAVNSTDGLVIIDTGINNNETRDCWDIIIKNLPLKSEINKIIITHHHPDHIGLSKYLADKLKVKVFAPKKELSRAKKIINLSNKEYSTLLSNNYEEFGLDKDITNKSNSIGNFYKGMVKELPNILNLEDDFQIKTKNGVWEARFDTGHSPSQLSLFDNVRKIYLCFDFLLPRISPNISIGIEDNENNVLEEYFKYLNSIIYDMQNDWVVIPGHEFPYYNPTERAKKLILHHRTRLELLITEIKKSPLTVKLAMEVLFGKIKNSHDLFFASCETKAHLNYLFNTDKILIDKKERTYKYKYNYRH